MNSSLSSTPAARPLRWPWCERAAFGKYAAVAALAFRQRLEERATLWGRVMFYAIILLTYSRLWQAVLGPEAAASIAGQGRAPTPASYVWYLAVTEWVVLAQPSIWLDIEADIRNGDVAYQLSRPISYAGAKIAEAFGDMVLRLSVLGVAGLLLARSFSGEWPSAMGLGLALLVGPLASIVLLLAHVAIGLSAFWLHDCNSVYLIWQKLVFVLGGLMLPLDIYPAWFATIASYTPFAALVFGPGRLVMDPDPELALRVAAQIGGWALLALLVVAAIERKGRAQLTLHGG